MLRMKIPIDQIDKLTNEVKKLKVSVRAFPVPESTQTSTIFRCKEFLPLATYDDLVHFEANIMDEPNKSDFVAFLRTVGGHSMEKMVANLVQAVYSVELQASTTWKGVKTPQGWAKRPIGTTKCPEMISGKKKGFY